MLIALVDLVKTPDGLFLMYTSNWLVYTLIYLEQIYPQQ